MRKNALMFASQLVTLTIQESVRRGAIYSSYKFSVSLFLSFFEFILYWTHYNMLNCPRLISFLNSSWLQWHSLHHTGTLQWSQWSVEKEVSELVFLSPTRINDSSEYLLVVSISPSIITFLSAKTELMKHYSHFADATWPSYQKNMPGSWSTSTHGWKHRGKEDSFYCRFWQAIK